MKRKQFLTSLLATGAAITMGQVSHASDDQNSESPVFKLPPYLKKGDTIGITSPAGFISIEDIQPSVLKLQEWGFKVRVGNTIGKRDFSLGGTDEERMMDLQSMLDDRNIKAIMCARGGYGSVRIIDRLNFKKFILYPKWIIGFSDVTVLHCHVHANFNIATLHAKMCINFPADWNAAEPVQQETLESIRRCLTGQKMHYTTAFHPKNKLGRGSGQLVGGNLKTIESLAGSKSDLNTKNKILFVEDTGEYLYSLDRMFWNLKRTGKLAGLKGLVLGGFKIKDDDPGEEFGKSLEDIVLEKVKEYDYPVCFNFPVGHQKNNYALKAGVSHSCTVNASGTILKEV